MYHFEYIDHYVTIDDEGGGVIFQAGPVAAEFAKKLVEQANQSIQQAVATDVRLEHYPDCTSLLGKECDCSRYYAAEPRVIRG